MCLTPTLENVCVYVVYVNCSVDSSSAHKRKRGLSRDARSCACVSQRIVKRIELNSNHPSRPAHSHKVRHLVDFYICITTENVKCNISWSYKQTRSRRSKSLSRHKRVRACVRFTYVASRFSCVGAVAEHSEIWGDGVDVPTVRPTRNKY